MNFYVQFGNGMKAITRGLLEEWGGGSVILSPRDLDRGKLVDFAADVHERNGKVLVDPQFYLPEATHHRLVDHDFWPSRYESDDFWGDEGNYTRLLSDLHALNADADSDVVVLPALHTDDLEDAWYDRQGSIQELADDLYGDDQLVYATVALGPSAIRDSDKIRSLLKQTNDWGVDGIYFVAEHPADEYLVTDPVWLSNVMELVAGWRLQSLDVVLGYSNQQMLMAACAAPTGIASGNWRNVRFFQPGKFTPDDDEIRRHSTWYYAPEALSEYQLDYLDIASGQGVLDEMKPPEDIHNEHADKLFGGPEPSASGFSYSPEAFTHYLLSFRQQVEASARDSYEDTKQKVEDRLERAVELTDRWNNYGVFGSYREFGEEEKTASVAALRVLHNNRGPMLGRHWDELT